MSRERERLDRLMGLLASEGAPASDLRASVMDRLARGGAFVRRSRWMRRVAVAAALVVCGWVAVDAQRAIARRTDLGEIGRRGAEWIAPSSNPGRVLPARNPQAPRRESRDAFAPWRKT